MESELEMDCPANASVKPVSRFLRFGLASIATLVLGGIILFVARATGMLVGDNTYWFQSLPWLLVPFAPIVGIAAAACPRRWHSSRFNIFIVTSIGAAMGCLFYCLFPRCFLLLGHPSVWREVPLFRNLSWFFTSDFEFEIASCWIAAGATAMLVTLTRRTPTVLATITMLCLLAVILPAPVFNFVTNNQELTVAFAVPASPVVSAVKPPRVVNVGNERHWLDLAGANAVADHVLEALRKAGIAGPYRVAEIDRCGTGKKALQIIVLNAAASGKVQLPEPDGTELIYVSEPDHWRTIPAQAPTLSRNVEVRPGASRSPLAMYWIQSVAPFGFGGGIRPD
jgi:hypothetical protein